MVFAQISLYSVYDWSCPFDYQRLKSVLLVQVGVHELLHSLAGHFSFLTLLVKLDFLGVHVLNCVFQLLECKNASLGTKRLHVWAYLLCLVCRSRERLCLSEWLLIVLCRLVTNVLIQHRFQLANPPFARVNFLCLFPFTGLWFAQHRLKPLNLTFLFTQLSLHLLPWWLLSRPFALT